jgi:hypothetical protein
VAQPILEELPTVSVRSIVEYPLPRGKLVIGVRGEPPDWVQPTLQRLGQLLTLPRDWDSYGARPVDPACAWAAWQVLLALLVEDTPVPSLVPTSRGGVQIEWHGKGIDLEIEVVKPEEFIVSFEDAVTGQAWEKNVRDDAGELASFAIPA